MISGSVRRSTRKPFHFFRPLSPFGGLDFRFHRIYRLKSEIHLFSLFLPHQVIHPQAKDKDMPHFLFQFRL